MNEITGNIVAFTDFEEKVDELQKEYLAFLNSLDYSLSEVGISQFNERTEKREGTPCIAFYTPFWFADVLNVEDPEAVRQIAEGNIYLYHFVTLKDDASDQQRSNANKYLALSDKLLKKALDNFSPFINEQSLKYTFSRYNHEWNQAEEYLRRHQGQMIPYNDKDFEMMGKKASMIKMCLPVLIAIADKQNNNQIEKATDNAATGLQFMDDLIDWREDNKAELNTYPLWLVKTPSQKGIPSINESEIRENIYLGGIVEDVLNKSNHYLTISKDLFNSTARYWPNFLDSTIQLNSSVIKIIESEKKGIEDKKPTQGYLDNLETTVRIYMQQT